MDSGGLSFNTLNSNCRMHNYNESFALYNQTSRLYSESITLADLTIWINNDKYLRKLKEKKKKQKDRESIHGL